MWRKDPGICFHDLPRLATIQGAILAIDAGTTYAGMALASGRTPGRYNTRVASGVESLQEGEAMTRLICAHQVAPQEGIFWVVLG